MKKAFLAAVLLLAIVFSALAGISLYIRQYAAPFIIEGAGGSPAADVCLVPGAHVYEDGRLSVVLRDRLERALALYRAGRARRVLLSGDHGPCTGGEVRAMSGYLLGRGVPRGAMLCDYGGYDTYHSMVRARRLFGVKGCLIVTQRFHLSRALYLARKTGLDAYGVMADLREYRYRLRYAVRELFANGKAVFEAAAGREDAAVSRCGGAASVSP
jgi:SanA protein